MNFFRLKKYVHKTSYEWYKNNDNLLTVAHVYS